MNLMLFTKALVNHIPVFPKILTKELCIVQVTRLFLFIKEEYGDKELALKFLTEVRH